ncbi:uncharacterized protein LOC134290572 [Aedes albopictus]|uniref:Peptidase aspartic putative domain-containing protein n=1 Tax=Aedes albopictus TaxID=7160 RepID=A0ABM1YM28_AEDAL
MEDVKALVHQRGQVKASVTTIVKALEKAEDDPSQVSLLILRVYSKKLDTFYNTDSEVLGTLSRMESCPISMIRCYFSRNSVAFSSDVKQINQLSQSPLPVQKVESAERAESKPPEQNVSVQSSSSPPQQPSTSSLYSEYSSSLKCLVTPKITNALPSKAVNTSDWKIPSRFPLADPKFGTPADIDLLIGVTEFFRVLKPGHLIIGDGLPELRETELGWVVAGEIQDESSVVVNPLQVNSVTVESLNDAIKRFWEIEEVDVQSASSTEQQECEELFRQSHQRDSDGRFVLKLPFRSNLYLLEDNRSMALRRFFFLEKRLRKQPDLQAQYSAFIEEYERLGHCKEIREIEDRPGMMKYYMPHHAVLRPDSSSTKLRVVFDASAKSCSSAASLNDVLQVGATVQSDLFSILLRFRMHRFVFTADITKMYRQVRVHPDQTSVQRIFWRSNPTERLRVLELQTVTYGTAAAPFLATQSLVQLCEDQGPEFPLAARIVVEDCYVDDVISGTDTIEEAVESCHQLQALLGKGGFPVHKWCANNELILADIPESEREKLLQLDQLSANEVIETLGLIWDPISDEFLYAIDNSPSEPTPVTKRPVFSKCARLFDPVGFLSPVVVLAKQLMQRTWLAKMDWDSPLEGDLLADWQRFCECLKGVNEIKVPRPVFCFPYATLEIHGFADASGLAYGACIYVRCVGAEGECSVQLLCSKSKIAPLQDMTIARKELCAALLLSRLVRKVFPILSVDVSVLHLWSDSQIVLAWLRKSPTVLQPFVRNRVVEIVQENRHTQWNYVRSKENPADVVSRGQSPEVLKENTLWWNGPAFLHSQDYEPAGIEEVRDCELPEMKSSSFVVVNALNVDDLPIFKRFSSFRKLQRIMAYVQRFIRNCHEKVVENRVKEVSPTITELRTALHTIVVLIQNEALFDEIQRVENNEPCRVVGKLYGMAVDCICAGYVVVLAFRSGTEPGGSRNPRVPSQDDGHTLAGLRLMKPRWLSWTSFR